MGFSLTIPKNIRPRLIFKHSLVYCVGVNMLLLMKTYQLTCMKYSLIVLKTWLNVSQSYVNLLQKASNSTKRSMVYN